MPRASNRFKLMPRGIVMHNTPALGSAPATDFGCSPDRKYDHVGWYLSNAKQAFEITLAGGEFNFGPWPGIRLDLDGFRREFRSALDRRINAKGGLKRRRGRKDTDEWRFSMERLAKAVNTPRLIVRERDCPPEYRDRLSHRLTLPCDEQ